MTTTTDAIRVGNLRISLDVDFRTLDLSAVDPGEPDAGQWITATLTANWFQHDYESHRGEARVKVGCYADGTTDDNQEWAIDMEGARVLAAILGAPCELAQPEGVAAMLRHAAPEDCEAIGAAVQAALLDAAKDA